MEKQSKKGQHNHCISCGKFFRPDKRVGNRQKTCGQEECRKKHQKVQQKKWRESNPNYFRGRSGYVNGWRKRHPEYQKQWRAKKHREIQTEIPPVSPIKSIRLNIRTKVAVSEIQTLVMSVVYAGEALWADGVGMHAPRDTIPDGMAGGDLR